LTPNRPRIDAGVAERHPLAEDNVVNQKLALRLLQQTGYRAHVASNGIEAIECVSDRLTTWCNRPGQRRPASGHGFLTPCRSTDRGR
jgi:hypothetical protein